MASLHVPRPWFRLDQRFLDQDTIADLGDRFGPAGPLTIVALIAEAASAAATKADPDVVCGRWSALARRVHIDVPTTKAVVQGTCDVGLVEVVEASDARFELRLVKYYAWHPKDAGAAGRKARQRSDRPPNRCL